MSCYPDPAVRYFPNDCYSPFNSIGFAPGVVYYATSNEDDVIASAKVKETVNSVYANSASVQAYIAACLTQKDIKLDKIKSLIQTQQEMREHARYWLDVIVPKVNSCYTDITGFCNLSSEYWEDLIKLAEATQKSDDDSAQQFKWGLADLKDNVQDKEKKATKLIDMFQSYRTDLESDNRNFQEVIADADRIYTGEKGLIKVTQDTISSLKTAIDRDIGLIAMGALVTVGGIAMIVVGAVGTVFTGGAAAKLVVAGVITTIGGVATVTAASIDLKAKQKEYAEQLAKLKELKDEVAALENVKNTFTSLKDKNTEAHAGVENMRLNWVTIYNNLNELEGFINTINPERKFFLTQKMRTAQKNFEDVKKVVLSAESNGMLKVQVDTALAENLRLSNRVVYSFPLYSKFIRRRVETHSIVLPVTEFINCL